MSSNRVSKRNLNRPSRAKMRKTESTPVQSNINVATEPVLVCGGGDTKMELEATVDKSGEARPPDQSLDLNQSGDTANHSQFTPDMTELMFADPEIFENFKELQKLLESPNEVVCLKRIFHIMSSILTTPWPWNLWKNRHQTTDKEPSIPHHHTSSEGRGHICVPVNIAVEKWFTDAVEHSKLEPEDFLVYLLLVYSQIHTSILTGEKPTGTSLMHQVTNTEGSSQGHKYPELTLSTLKTEISTMTELFDSNTKPESVREEKTKDKATPKGTRTISASESNVDDVRCEQCNTSGNISEEKGKETKDKSSVVERRTNSGRGDQNKEDVRQCDSVSEQTGEKVRRSTRGRRMKSGRRDGKVEDKDVVKLRGRPLTTIAPGLKVVGGDVIPIAPGLKVVGGDVIPEAEAEGENAVRVGCARKILQPRVKPSAPSLDTDTGADGEGALPVAKKDYILHKDKTAKTAARRYIYECRSCRKSCHGWASWSNHKRQHVTNHPDIVCPTCGWITKTKAGMWAHRKRHGNIREKCPHCEYTNYVKSAVNVHIMQVHPEMSKIKPRVYICETCKRKFKTSSNLRTHLKLHKRLVRDQVCSVCDKSFYSRKLLQDHVRTVHADKQYICEKCDKKFAKSQTLEAHINRVHLRIKAIGCSYADCDDRFYEKKDLRQHIVVYHTKEKNYPCEWEACKKCFRTLYQRKIHMRIHTDEKPLKCPHCDYSARQRSSLTCHLKKHAPESASDTVIKSSAPGRRKRRPLPTGETRTVTFVASVPAQSGAVINQTYDAPLVAMPPPSVRPMAQLDWLNFTVHMQKEALNSEPSEEALAGQTDAPTPLFTTVPVLSGEQAAAAFPGADFSEHSGSFRATIVNMDFESSGKPTFTKTVIDIPESDKYKTVPVLDMAGQVPNNSPYVRMPVTTDHQSGPSMVTVPVFTAEELTNMTSLMTTRQPMGVTMATENLAQQPNPMMMTEAVIPIITSDEQPKYGSLPTFPDAEHYNFLKPQLVVTMETTDQSHGSVVPVSSASRATDVLNIPITAGDNKTDISVNSMLLPAEQQMCITMAQAEPEQQRKPLATEDTVSMVTSQEQQNYLSMPIFTDAEGFSFLKPKMGITTREQDASIMSQASASMVDITLATPDERIAVPMESIATELRHSPVFTTVAMTASPADHAMATMSTSVLSSQNVQGDAGCSALVLGALRQLAPSFQTVELHPISTTTTSSLYQANFLSDNDP